MRVRSSSRTPARRAVAAYVMAARLTYAATATDHNVDVRIQLDAMPSPPTAPGTVTEPTAVNVPPVPIRNALTMPFAPVCTYRFRLSDDTVASTVPASVAVVPTADSLP